jgi:RNA polymerase sigma factor (sigma-70 family)
MIERSDSDREKAARTSAAAVAALEVDAWFVREILPLESALMEYLQHNWRNRSDIYDFRQEVYIRLYEAALKEIPGRPKQFLFAIARNFLINRVRHEQIVPIEAVADLEALEIAADMPTADRALLARDELRQLQAALDHLSPRCREAVVLARIEGLSRNEIAIRMGVAESAVSKYLSTGIRKLVEVFYGEPKTVRRKA